MPLNQIFYRIERLLFLHRVSLLWLGYAYVVYRNFIETEGALTSWHHLTYTLSDWLINYADGLTRRGLAGEIAITLSQWFGGTPAIWAWFLSSLLGGIFFLLAIRLMKRLPDDSKMLPLVLAPWGLMFFTYDTGASFRKEIIGYLALIAILQGVIADNVRAARIWAGIGTVVFLIGMFAHEAIIFLLPALMLAFFLLYRRWLTDGIWFATCAVTCTMLGIVVLVVLTMLPFPDANLLCEAAKFPCDAHGTALVGGIHAFVWITRDMSDAIAYLLIERDWIDLPIYASIALLSVLPMFGFRILGVALRWHWALLLVSTVCIMPLFVIGIDWGRWIQMLVLPFSLVGISALISGFAEYRRLLPPWAAVLYVSTWSFSHVFAEYYFNALHLLPVLGILVAVSWIWSRVVKRGKVSLG